MKFSEFSIGKPRGLLTMSVCDSEGA